MRIFVITMAVMAGLMSNAWGESRRPTPKHIDAAAGLAPEPYRERVTQALKAAGSNGSELITALENAVTDAEKEALGFLIANMPPRDLKELNAEYLLENVRYAMKAREQAPWGETIPQDIFLNDVLPYASLNEKRDRWRKDFYDRFMSDAAQAGTVIEAVRLLYEKSYKDLQVEYHATKRHKPDQSPYESMEIHYASCTGLSILLIDVLRAVGIPARAAGIPMWVNKSGNHTWIEVWDEGWHHVGAREPSVYGKPWTPELASQVDPTKPEHRIYATSFKPTGLSFPAVWKRNIRYIPALDVTQRYIGTIGPPPAPSSEIK